MAARTLPVPLPTPPAGAPAVGAAVAAVVLLSTALAGTPAGLLALGLAPAAGAALVDRRDGRVPDALVALTAAVAAVAVVAGLASVWTVLAGTAVTTAPLLAIHLVDPDRMGFGDAKLAAALGAVLAPLDVRAGLAALAVGSGAALATAAALRRRSVPFAPGLVAGASVALVALLALGWEAPRWR
jgi:leader peptidase (prepilin peptidase)/N-methyltransferase